MNKPEELRFNNMSRADEAIGMVALVVVVGSILWGVISRYVLPQPASWTYEVAMIAFSWVVFFGAITGVRLGTHASIDIVLIMLPQRLQDGIRWFNFVLLALLFVILAGLFAWQAWLTQGLHLVVTDLPRSLFYAPLSLASAAMLMAHLRYARPVAGVATENTSTLI